jgi:hypothetical protein
MSGTNPANPMKPGMTYATMRPNDKDSILLKHETFSDTPETSL